MKPEPGGDVDKDVNLILRFRGKEGRLGLVAMALGRELHIRYAGNVWSDDICAELGYTASFCMGRELQRDSKVYRLFYFHLIEASFDASLNPRCLALLWLLITNLLAPSLVYIPAAPVGSMCPAYAMLLSC
jgi:hypothetical protein